MLALEQALLDRFSDQPRAQAIIRHRYSLLGADPKTLEELGEGFGVTRERIRQLEKRESANVLALLEQGHNRGWELEPALVDFFRELCIGFRESVVAGVMSLADFREGLAARLGFHVPSLSRGLPLLIVEQEQLSVVQGRLGRTFVFHAKDSGYIRDFTEWVGQIETDLRSSPEPLMKVDFDARLALRPNRFGLSLNQVLALLDLEWLSPTEFQVPLELLAGRPNQACRVLRQAGRPLHFREITARIQEATGEEDLNDRNVSNQISLDARLAPIGRSGLWGLAEWGAETGTVKDVIASVLMNSPSPLSQLEVWKQVSEVRPCAPTSVAMYLADEPTFKRIGDDSYIFDAEAQRGDDWNRETVGGWIDEFFETNPLAVVALADLTEALVHKSDGIEDERAFKILLGHHPALHSERDRQGNTFVSYRPSWRHVGKRQRRMRRTLQTEVDELLTEMLRWRDVITLNEAVQRLEKETDSPPSALYGYVSKSPSCTKFEIDGVKHLKAANDD